MSGTQSTETFVFDILYVRLSIRFSLMGNLAKSAAWRPDFRPAIWPAAVSGMQSCCTSARSSGANNVAVCRSCQTQSASEGGRVGQSNVKLTCTEEFEQPPPPSTPSFPNANRAELLIPQKKFSWEFKPRSHSLLADCTLLYIRGRHLYTRCHKQVHTHTHTHTHMKSRRRLNYKRC
jgi:hypothetical protein